MLGRTSDKDGGPGSEVRMDTFVVQVWVPADDPSRGGDLRGVVRHVASGTETPFRGDEGVLDLLHHALQTGENERCVRREAAQ